MLLVLTSPQRSLPHCKAEARWCLSSSAHRQVCWPACCQSGLPSWSDQWHLLLPTSMTNFSSRPIGSRRQRPKSTQLLKDSQPACTCSARRSGSLPLRTAAGALGNSRRRRSSRLHLAPRRHRFKHKEGLVAPHADNHKANRVLTWQAAHACMLPAGHIWPACCPCRRPPGALGSQRTASAGYCASHSAVRCQLRWTRLLPASLAQPVKPSALVLRGHDLAVQSVWRQEDKSSKLLQDCHCGIGPSRNKMLGHPRMLALPLMVPGVPAWQAMHAGASWHTLVAMDAAPPQAGGTPCTPVLAAVLLACPAANPGSPGGQACWTHSKGRRQARPSGMNQGASSMRVPCRTEGSFARKGPKPCIACVHSCLPAPYCCSALPAQQQQHPA
jgi:hypothetical protein